MVRYYAHFVLLTLGVLFGLAHSETPFLAQGGQITPTQHDNIILMATRGDLWSIDPDTWERQQFYESADGYTFIRDWVVDAKQGYLYLIEAPSGYFAPYAFNSPGQDTRLIRLDLITGQRDVLFEKPDLADIQPFYEPSH